MRSRCATTVATPIPALWLIALAALLAGCTNSSVAAARGEIAAGHYAAAHQDLVNATRNSGQLSASERREVADDLCLTEFKIGAPAYPLAEQHHVCAAASTPGSGSATTLEQVEEAQRDAAVSEITNAISHGDIAQADAAIVRYQSIPGSDPRAVAQWSHQLWSLVNRNERASARGRGGRVASAVSAAARQYPQMNAMNERAFQHWVEDHATVAGTRMVSSVTVGRDTLNLWIPDDRLGTARLNLDRFAHINDALVARCHCDGRTNIAVQGSDLPAYLVRLDPETHRSEVLILAPQ